MAPAQFAEEISIACSYSSLDLQKDLQKGDLFMGILGDKTKPPTGPRSSSPRMECKQRMLPERPEPLGDTANPDTNPPRKIGGPQADELTRLEGEGGLIPPKTRGQPKQPGNGKISR